MSAHTHWLPEKQRMKDEKIILFLRRHGFVLFLKMLFILLLATIPVGVYFFLKNLFPTIGSDNITYAFIVMLGSAYYLFLIVSAYNTFIDFYFDIWIVTTHRVINMELQGLFNFTSSEQSLAQVQDVQAEIKGVFPTIIDYGNVLIQSAGAKNLFHFEQVHDPEHVARKINALAQQFRGEKL